MNSVLWIHVASGMLALLLGTVAVAARKGKRLHVSAGAWFCVAMLVLGVTAAMLEPYRKPPGSPIGGVMVCYFVATAWMTARRRDGSAGWFEKIACAVVILIGAAMIAEGIDRIFAPAGKYTVPPFSGVVIALEVLCLLAGLGDLKFIRGKLSPTQRLSRHLWRMCFAFFIATGSFFLGQQQVLPHAIRGSSILWVLAFAPFVVMLFWLVRVRLSRKDPLVQTLTLPAEG
jgi:uncharacterized membrane protein